MCNISVFSLTCNISVFSLMCNISVFSENEISDIGHNTFQSKNNLSRVDLRSNKISVLSLASLIIAQDTKGNISVLNLIIAQDTIGNISVLNLIIAQDTI